MSAMVDDEADELEVRRVLREIASDPDLKRKWSRYHAISSALKREGRSNLKESDLVDVLPREHRSRAGSTNAINQMPGKSRRMGHGTLVASLVAAIMILSILVNVDDEEAEQVEFADSSMTLNPVVRDERIPTESDIRRAEAYLIRHALHVPMNSSAAPIPFAKVIAHETKK
tara:strand:- start:94 stop:609 length:516 start_codon:yes stop_codon:yes gene_type:complete